MRAGRALNICVNVTRTGKYKFAGRDRDSLADIVYFLRQKPLQSKTGGSLTLGKPAAAKDDAIAKDEAAQRARSHAPPIGVDRQAFVAEQAMLDATAEAKRQGVLARKAEFARGGGGGGGGHVDDGELRLSAMVPFAPRPPPASVPPPTLVSPPQGGGDELYDEVELDSSGQPMLGMAAAEEMYVGYSPTAKSPGASGAPEPLYVDMRDANVPSFEWIAREEERHVQAISGASSPRLTNEEFGRLRQQARQRASIAAAKAQAELDAKDRALRKKAEFIKAQVATKEEDENFFEYNNASIREFGADEEIYDAVPPWFAGRIDRDACETAIVNGQDGNFLVRESSKGDKFIICLRVGGRPKNFQIHIVNGKYKFSGIEHPTIEAVVTYCQKHGIYKDGVQLAVGRAARY